MTPGQPVNLVRDGVLCYTARVMRLASFGDAILEDVRYPDGREVKPTGGNVAVLRLRCKVKTGDMVSHSGFAGQLKAVGQ